MPLCLQQGSKVYLRFNKNIGCEPTENKSRNHFCAPFHTSYDAICWQHPKITKSLDYNQTHPLNDTITLQVTVINNNVRGSDIRIGIFGWWGGVLGK